jgi:uncharacterized membrane protein YoaK (UPF0700 family)
MKIASEACIGPSKAAVQWLCCRVMIDRQHGRRARRRGKIELQVADGVAVSGDLISLVWHHKLWWMVPLLVVMVFLAALVVLEATPIGPLLYPLF